MFAKKIKKNAGTFWGYEILILRWFRFGSLFIKLSITGLFLFYIEELAGARFRLKLSGIFRFVFSV